MAGRIKAILSAKVGRKATALGVSAALATAGLFHEPLIRDQIRREQIYRPAMHLKENSAAMTALLEKTLPQERKLQRMHAFQTILRWSEFADSEFRADFRKNLKGQGIKKLDSMGRTYRAEKRMLVESIRSAESLQISDKRRAIEGLRKVLEFYDFALESIVAERKLKVQEERKKAPKELHRMHVPKTIIAKHTREQKGFIPVRKS